jgi:hypothetical protein
MPSHVALTDLISLVSGEESKLYISNQYNKPLEQTITSKYFDRQRVWGLTAPSLGVITLFVRGNT